jgi:hypothetical protein
MFDELSNVTRGVTISKNDRKAGDIAAIIRSTRVMGQKYSCILAGDYGTLPIG